MTAMRRSAALPPPDAIPPAPCFPAAKSVLHVSGEGGAKNGKSHGGAGASCGRGLWLLGRQSGAQFRRPGGLGGGCRPTPGGGLELRRKARRSGAELGRG